MRLILMSFFLLSLSMLQVYVEAGEEVEHKHGERSHSHPLPESGLNHSHNKNKAPKEGEKISDEWVYLGGSESLVFEVKRGSFQSRRNKSGDLVGRIIVQQIDKLLNKVDTYQEYITHADCFRGYGKVALADMRGDFLEDYDYVRGGSSIASKIGDTICSSVLYQKLLG